MGNPGKRCGKVFGCEAKIKLSPKQLRRRTPTSTVGTLCKYLYLLHVHVPQELHLKAIQCHRTLLNPAIYHETLKNTLSNESIPPQTIHNKVIITSPRNPFYKYKVA